MSCQIRKMKMMAAASCEERSPQTHCAKEVSNNYQKMMAERARQDSMWQTTSENICKTDANKNGQCYSTPTSKAS